MAGLIVTLLFCCLVSLAAWPLIKAKAEALDDAESLGLAGLLGLGAIGLLTLFIGLIPGGLQWGIFLVVGLPLGLLAWSGSRKTFAFPVFKKPEGAGFILLAVICLFTLIPLVATLAPSDTTDWDSLAYHLAVPKLWLQAGQIQYVQGIHHSNFPFTIDNLFIWGQFWGGQAGAKAFSFAFLLLGAVTIFGFVRRVSGSANGGWWAVLAFVGMPVVLWESGTAYIDVGHGLYTSFAFAYTAEAVGKILRKESVGSLAVLAGLCLGFAVGSKFTGLQSMLAIALAAAIALVVGKQAGSGAKMVATVVGLGLLVSAPWFIKTTAYTGNPVYPFFYSVLGGKDWDGWRADLYRDEQQSFGVGRTPTGRDVTQIGHAVLGLAYQPGRYVNPGQTQGMGFPTGAIGFAVMLTLFLVAIGGKRSREDSVMLGAVGILFLLWFFLSQQSRYLTIVGIPACLLLGSAVARRPWGQLLMAAVGAQALYTIWLLGTTQTQTQLQVVTGRVTPEEHQTARISFFPAAQAINKDESVRKVALYDEVFGYLLDKPYFWANPGHSKKIPYETLVDGKGYAAAMKELGFSHVYLNLQFMPRDVRDRWLQAAGLAEGEPYSAEERAAMTPDLNLRWRLLLADAIRQGELTVTGQFRSSLLLKFSN